MCMYGRSGMLLAAPQFDDIIHDLEPKFLTNISNTVK
jgi:hypothetical protein